MTTRLDDIAREPLSQIGAAVLVRSKDEQNWQRKHLRQEWASSGTNLLPTKVIGYSTGPTSGLQWALSLSIDRFIRNRLGSFQAEAKPDGMPLADWEQYREQMIAYLEAERDRYLDNPTTLFLGAEDALLAALALLAHEGVQADEREHYLSRRREILSRIALDPLSPLLAFTFHVSGDWYNRLTAGRRDRLRDLLRKATVRTPVDFTAASSLSEPPPRDFFAVFDLDETFRHQALGSLAPTPLAFFEDLVAWKRQGGIKAVRFVLKKEGIDSAFPESRLSDGEFLLLGRYALLSYQLYNVVILLDEPETHFNDHWKVNLVKDICFLLEPSLASGNKSVNEVVIATHSDLTLTDADPNQVYLFEEASLVGGSEVIVKRPALHPFAANRGEISRLLFKTAGETGTYAKELIERALVDRSKERVEELLRTVGPGFYRFRLRDLLLELETKEG